MSIKITIQPTPNPNSLKFICSMILKTEGKASLVSPEEAQDIYMAQKLFSLNGVEQIHFFQNVLTVTKFDFIPWDNLSEKIVEAIQESIPYHSADFETSSPEKTRREGLSQELQIIEEILDRKIRPGLQSDGGDLICVEFHTKDKVLIIGYQGACGTCPSSTQGTLEAIRGILREDFDPEIQVFIAPPAQSSL